jgi:hypothetical protein
MADHSKKEPYLSIYLASKYHLNTKIFSHTENKLNTHCSNRTTV